MSDFREQESQIRLGGGAAAIKRQHEKGRLTARERISKLIDPGTPFFELGLWAAWEMYEAWGSAPSAGVVVGVGVVMGRRVMIVANDATVKAGSFFPLTAKKVLRAQRIARENHLPLAYLVDSAGVFLPLQDEVFPDEDDFGRIFRNNAVISAEGIPQLAAIMGNCVAGGGYLPVLCDTLLMTEGSGLYLAGPALVKAAIGQTVSHEELGGAAMHAAISGTIDYREPNDETCLERMRRLIDTFPAETCHVRFDLSPGKPANEILKFFGSSAGSSSPAASSGRGAGPPAEYDVRGVLDCIVDAGPFDEYKAEFGQSLVCGFAKLGGVAVGVVANQRKRVKPAVGPTQFGGVIYADAADKAARFVMDCNQSRTPILFFQDVSGFMVGRDSEQAGIIRSGAKLVNAISNSVVPKITVILGGSFGAGNYALCGKAFDPRFIFAWPTAKYAVMGAETAASTLLDITVAALRRSGSEVDAAEIEQLRTKVAESYQKEMDVRYAAARLWVDAIIEPESTRAVLLEALAISLRNDEYLPFKTGVMQV